MDEHYKASRKDNVFSKILKIFNTSMQSTPDEQDKNKFVIGISNLSFPHVFSHLRLMVQLVA